MASGSLKRIGLCPEVTWGTAVVAPAYEVFPYVKGDMTLVPDTLVDDRMAGDRQIRGIAHGNRHFTHTFETNLAYGTYDTLLQAVLMGTWTNDVLLAGIARQSFLREDYNADLVGTPYDRGHGIEFGGMSLTLTQNEIVKVAFTGIGKDLDVPAAAAIADSTYGDPGTTEALNFKQGSISEGGGASLGIVTGFTLNIENGLTERNVVGTGITLQPDVGNCLITGSLECWLHADCPRGKFLAETETTLALTFADAAGNTLAFSLPALKYTGGTPTQNGPGSIPISFPFSAYYDAVATSNITVTRNPIA